MENLAKLVEDIVKKSDEEKDNKEQISKFDETLKMLSGLEFTEKPTYSLPPIDTLGKKTYALLNRK